MLREGNIVVRTIRPEELEFFWEKNSDPEIQGDFNNKPLISLAAMQSEYHKTGYWWSETGRNWLFIQDESCGNVVGVIGVQVIKQGVVSLHYHLFSREYWGMGYTSRAVRLVVDYLFVNRPINRIMLTTQQENIASRKVAEKCGFVPEGVSREAIFSRGKWVDQANYGLLRSDWQSRAKK